MPHQCPRCELRFVTDAELRDHLDVDHAVDTTGLERYRYPAAGGEPRGDDRHHRTRRVLVIANQTLGGSELQEAIRHRTEAGPASFFVLVPATHSAHLSQAGSGQPVSAPADTSDDKGVALARWRLRVTIDALHAAGVEAEGAIGHPDPVRAVADLLHSQDIDEIIVSTLPKGLSRWLEADLATQLERRFHLPVTSVVSHPSERDPAR